MVGLIILPSKLTTTVGSDDGTQFRFSQSEKKGQQFNRKLKKTSIKKVTKMKSLESREEILRERMNPLRFLDKNLLTHATTTKANASNEIFSNEMIGGNDYLSVSSFDDENCSTSCSNITTNTISSPSQSPLIKRHFAHLFNSSTSLCDDVYHTPERYNSTKKHTPQQYLHEMSFYSPTSQLILPVASDPFTNNNNNGCLSFELDVQAALLEPSHHFHSSHEDIQSILPSYDSDDMDDRWKSLLHDDISWL
eukprot:CAMPEP_0170061788 /NCGR_PEP_ID=MMETSP0019_2-20121128/3235_1 /TAXON_ID=98059 /ORGANISM="Dinobryon sp., Strain UTEXLB2267" /LENGTH=250 /DNA_ID=CAMNT_0010267727 /DNA_START=110 /DNA_END=862 /DNA_ORIENTATION=+